MKIILGETSMPNIKDIAEATGYSRTTVSKAFNDYTDISAKAKKTILKAAKELGYYPNAQARGLKMRRSFTIGVILDELLGYGLSHPFFSTVIQAFRVAVEEEGYSMIMIANKLGVSHIESYISHCNQMNVDAVFILCTDSANPGIQELIHSTIPTVLFDMPHEDTSCVMSNHYQGAKDAVEYLIQLGHEKIAHIYGSQLTFAGKERVRGFNDGMKAHGLEVQAAYQQSGGYFDLKYAKVAMEALLALEEGPTAVFASGDMMALGAAQVCNQHGVRIPEDLSLIGFDNLQMLDWIQPSITSVGQNYRQIGQTCCKMLTKMIDKKVTENLVEVIDTSIVERSSCAGPKR